MRLKFYLIVLMLVTIDLITKYYIDNMIAIYDPIIINNFVILNKVYNKGLVFGFAHSESVFINYSLTFLMTCLLLYLIYYVNKVLTENERVSNITFVAWSLVLGGGLANYIDRLIDNKVVDFILVRYENYYFPGIFNVADIFISLALVIFIFIMFFEDEKESKL
tara:strand:+ start:125 stop:616 length:492 start_codon:yes stop_codon:yes gene_type:complete